MQKPAERLGSFFLGAEYDLKNRQVTETPINYDARDLTTHAVCVGMTGSGKTGLCIGLLEEAALDSVPAILVDPKGDLTNLLLQFPELRPEDFRPWINVDDARRKGQSEDEFSQATADLWRNGLADWGMSGDRIRQLSKSAEFTIYTPGSTAGVPISILTSLAAPQIDFAQNAEAIRERISGTVSALLGLVGLNVDTVRSQEAILLSTIMEHFWSQDRDIDLTTLITAIQNPPVAQVGVLDLESFFPKKDRFQLAMAFNNLIAAPSFQSWLEGDALDIDQLLYTQDGKPRHSIFYIAHLSDNERMFFVTLLLENVLGWVRRQSGTSSLRALLYFDEVFGFFPPVSEPPSKRPLLTLLKQARAFGLGVVLVTQNPADLDYKGLTNAGTWFIGKLQAERDKQRLLEGLQTAASIDAPDYGDIISQLSSRVFLLHNVHEDKPVVMHTRWAMSYLRGPLTRPQIETLVPESRRTQAARPVSPGREAHPTNAQVADARRPAVSGASIPGLLPTPPSLDPSIPQVFVPVEVRLSDAIDVVREGSVVGGSDWTGYLLYRPVIVADAEVSFSDSKLKVDTRTHQTFIAEFPDQAWRVNWDRAETIASDAGKLESRPLSPGKDEGPFFARLTESIDQAKLKRLEKDLTDWLYANSRLSLTSHPDLGITQLPDESEREFTLRLRQAAREHRDQEVDALEKKYASRLDKVEARHKRLQDDYLEDKAEFDARQQQELLNAGEGVLGMLLGRRSRKSVGSYATKRQMTRKARVSLDSTEREIADLEDEMEELEKDLAQEAEEITNKWADSLDEGLSTTEVKPRRTDVDVNLVAVGWVPVWMLRPSGEPIERAEAVLAYKTAEQKR